MIESVDVMQQRVLLQPPNPPILVTEEISTGKCACMAVVGYRMDNPEAMAAMAQYAQGDLPQEKAHEWAKEMLSTAVIACEEHLADGSCERMYEDLVTGLRDGDPDRDDRPVTEVLEELMMIHLTGGPLQ